MGKQDKMKGGQKKQKQREECPKSDGFSPFVGLCVIKQDIYVKLNPEEEKCAKLIGIGGANITALWAASKTCGAVGEWKRRVVEELSAVFFVGGYETWPKNENDTIDVETELGNF